MLTESVNQELTKEYQQHAVCRFTIASLLAMYPQVVVDYDTQLYRSASLSFNINGGRYFVRFEFDGGNLLEPSLLLFAMDKPISNNSNEGFVFNEKKKLHLLGRIKDRAAFSKHLNGEMNKTIQQFIAEADAFSSG